MVDRRQAILDCKASEECNWRARVAVRIVEAEQARRAGYWGNNLAARAWSRGVCQARLKRIRFIRRLGQLSEEARLP